jgi:hypothetical protein
MLQLPAQEVTELGEMTQAPQVTPLSEFTPQTESTVTPVLGSDQPSTFRYVFILLFITVIIDKEAVTKKTEY